MNTIFLLIIRKYMQKIVSLALAIKELWSIKKQQKVKNMWANHFVPKFTILYSKKQHLQVPNFMSDNNINVNII